MNDIKFTAIVPVYNVENYLEECLNSIQNQIEKFNEVILINDGSTDNSLAICQKYCKKYNYFKLINQKNQGQSKARNEGIYQSIGDYVVFIDSDDYIDDKLVYILKSEIEKHDVDVLFYSAKIQYDIEHKMSSNSYFRKKDLCGKTRTGLEFLIDSFKDNYIVSPCLAAYKRELIIKKEIYFPEGIFYEDNVFLLNVYMLAQKVTSIADELYIRRIRTGSTTISKISLKKCKDMIQAVMLQWNILYHYQYKYKYLEPYFLRKFVAKSMVNLIQMLDEVEEEDLLTEKRNNLTELFFKYWYNLFNEKTKDWCESGILYYFCKEYERKNNSQEILYIVENSEKRLYAQLKKWLQDIPFFKQNKTIAIYGIGKHTESLINLYERIYGIIQSNIYFVITKNEDINQYYGKKVVSCSEIAEDTDYVVISSLIYQNEILKELDNQNKMINKRITLYNQNEIYDLVVLSKIMS